MKAAVSFTILTGYLQTGFEELRKKAVSYHWNTAIQQGVWTFYAKDLPEVTAILGVPLDFDPDHFQPLIDHAPNIRKAFNLPDWKGKDGVRVTEAPNVFIVTEHRKIETKTGFDIKEYNHEIPKENVQTAWKVISRQPLDKPIRTRTVAENIMKELNITRFNRESGSFDFAKLFGNRRDYFCLVYWPLKVLSEYYLAIKYHKSGKIERISDILTDQLTFDSTGEV